MASGVFVPIPTKPFLISVMFLKPAAWQLPIMGKAA